MYYDGTPVPGTTMKDLYLETIREYFLYYKTFDLFEESSDSRERILLNSEILKETDHGLCCTVGGLLMFGLHPEKDLPQNGISFAHFQGPFITDALIDKKTITGRLPHVADQVMTVIKNNQLNPSIIVGVKREERVEYPLTVLREAIVNSLVHRDYSIRGSKIRVFMFSDRIEIRSPGRLPNTVTVEKMKIGVSYARNPFLVKYMENLRYIDQLGRGVPMILHKMRDLEAKEPLMIEDGEEFILTIYKPDRAHNCTV